MIRLGPAGNVAETTAASMHRLHELGVNANELEFVQSVFLSRAKAVEVGRLAKRFDIKLSIHASYYINLASDDPKKIAASKQRILDSCERGNDCGAEFIVFHPAFYGKRSAEETFAVVKRHVNELLAILKENSWNVRLALETTGKKSAFGSLDELLLMRKETGCSICVDFAHLLARTGTRDYGTIFKRLNALPYVHCHLSGIEYTDKGEKRHIMTEKSDIKDLLSHAVKCKADMTIINESPEPLGDTLKTMKILASMQR